MLEFELKSKPAKTSSLAESSVLIFVKADLSRVCARDSFRPFSLSTQAAARSLHGMLFWRNNSPFVPVLRFPRQAPANGYRFLVTPAPTCTLSLEGAAFL